MSNPDNFIDEVSDEVRRDRFFAILRRYGWIVILLIIAAVGVAGWHEWQKAAHQETAQQFGDRLSAALEGPDAGRAAALEAIAQEEGGRRAALAVMLAAGAGAGAGSAAPETVAELGRLADDAGLPQLWRDLARLKQVMLAGAAMPMSERQAAVDALARPGAPFRPLAMEQSALLALERGETGAAVSTLQQLRQEPALTPALTRRVSQLLIALGAQPAAG